MGELERLLFDNFELVVVVEMLYKGFGSVANDSENVSWFGVLQLEYPVRVHLFDNVWSTPLISKFPWKEL